jgi:hypothetical protein
MGFSVVRSRAHKTANQSHRRCQGAARSQSPKPVGRALSVSGGRCRAASQRLVQLMGRGRLRRHGLVNCLVSVAMTGHDWSVVLGGFKGGSRGYKTGSSRCETDRLAVPNGGSLYMM